MHKFRSCTAARSAGNITVCTNTHTRDTCLRIRAGINGPPPPRGAPGKKSSASSLGNLRSALRDKNSNKNSNLGILSLTNFLKTRLGINREPEIRRIIDIMTNKNSLFGSKRGSGQQPSNPYARMVTVDEVESVMDCLIGFGFEDVEIRQLVLAFPQLLCYSVDERLRVVLEYFVNDVGISRADVKQMLLARPTILGLPRGQLEQMLGFLVENGTSQDEIVNLLAKSLIENVLLNAKVSGVPHPPLNNTASTESNGCDLVSSTICLSISEDTLSADGAGSLGVLSSGREDREQVVTKTHKGSDVNSSLTDVLFELCNAEKLFQACAIHDQYKKNECNFFWFSNGSTNTKVCCRHCEEVTSNGRDGSLLQVRRYMHRNVVHVEDISRAHDCRGIQSYYINQKRAILLEPKEQNAGSTPVFDTRCVTCQVPLRPDCSFCSLSCELHAHEDLLNCADTKTSQSYNRKRAVPSKRQGSSAKVAKVAKVSHGRGRQPSREWARKPQHPQRAPEI